MKLVLEYLLIIFTAGTIVYGSAPDFRTDASESVFLSKPIDTWPPVNSTLQFILMVTMDGLNVMIELGDNCSILISILENDTTPEGCPALSISSLINESSQLNLGTALLNITVDQEFLKLNSSQESESGIKVSFVHNKKPEAEIITASIYVISEDSEEPADSEPEINPTNSETVSCECNYTYEEFKNSSSSSVSVHLSTLFLSLSLITIVIFVFR